MTPIADYLPGAYSDTLAVQNWVKMTDGNYHVLWSSLDAPIVGFSGLWPGYVSPAHRCYMDPSMKHDPLKEDDLNSRGIYSNLFFNNLGTNFAVSQVVDILFRTVLNCKKPKTATDIYCAYGIQRGIKLQQSLHFPLYH